MKNKWFSKIIYTFGDAKFPFISNVRIPLLAFMILGYLFVTFAFSGSATPAYAAEKAKAPSYGKGVWELIIFSDYFCPPCQSIEKDLEPVVEKLLARGDVKITFVDFPGHQYSSLYAKYFLYAAAAEPGYKNALKARIALFSLAIQNTVQKDAALSAALNKQGISLKTFEHKPVFTEWTQMTKQYEVTQTPTCILRHSSTYMRKYGDADQIRQLLLPELKKIENSKRK